MKILYSSLSYGYHIKIRQDIESRMYGSRDRSSSRTTAADDDDDKDDNNNSSFASRRASRAPVTKYEPIEAKKIACPDCGQQFVSERAMQIHLSTMHEKTTKVTFSLVRLRLDS